MSTATKPRDKRKRRPRPAWKSTTVIRWSVAPNGVVLSVTTTTTGGA